MELQITVLCACFYSHIVDYFADISSSELAVTKGVARGVQGTMTPSYSLSRTDIG